MAWHIAAIIVVASPMNFGWHIHGFYVCVSSFSLFILIFKRNLHNALALNLHAHLLTCTSLLYRGAKHVACVYMM